MNGMLVYTKGDKLAICPLADFQTLQKDSSSSTSFHSRPAGQFPLELVEFAHCGPLSRSHPDKNWKKRI